MIVNIAPSGAVEDVEDVVYLHFNPRVHVRGGSVSVSAVFGYNHHVADGKYVTAKYVHCVLMPLDSVCARVRECVCVQRGR